MTDQAPSASSLILKAAGGNASAIGNSTECTSTSAPGQLHEILRWRGVAGNHDRAVAGLRQILSRQRSNVMSFVVHRTTQGWRCASAHNTDVAPGAETNVVNDQGQLRSVTYRDQH